MRKKAAFFIALRYLWARAHEGGRYLRGAAAGIAVSLIPIIVTLIVADGMIMGIIDRYLELGTGHIQVYDMLGYGNEDITINQIMEIDGVKGVWSEQKGMGVLAGRSGRTGVTVRSIESSFWDDPGSARYLKIIEGGHKPENDTDIMLGETLALNIGASVGDTVRLMTIRESEQGRLTPRMAAFTVKGIISCGYNEIDALWCIINMEGGRRVLSMEQTTASLMVKVDDPYKKADYFASEIALRLGTGYNVFTWRSLLRAQYSSYEATRQILLFIMALVVIIAAVNVASATSMLVLERQRDIAILKIAGSKISGVTDIFICSSFLTGLAGSIIGISSGLLIGTNINFLIRSLENFLSFFTNLFSGEDVKILDPGFYLETIPITVDWNMVFIIWFFTILCSVLASLIPARKAGRLKPMELLRKT